MRDAWNLNKLMKHMRDDHGFEDLRGSDRKLRLRNMGYFHGYKGFRFVRKPSERLALASFDDLERVYEFDARMKSIFYPRVMEVEIALKNLILARLLEACSDPSLATFLREGLDDCRQQNGSVSKTRMRRKLDLKSTLHGVVRESYKSSHVSHYINRDDDVPMWSVFESMSLGNLSRLARCLKPEIEGEILDDMGIPTSQPGMIADIIEVIRPLRNCIAHNGVIFDARFSQAVIHGHAGPIAVAGALVKRETSLSYEPQFNSIVDYVVFISMLIALITRRKTDARRFVKECRDALAALQEGVGIDMYMKIAGSGDRQKLDAALGFVAESR